MSRIVPTLEILDYVLNFQFSPAIFGQFCIYSNKASSASITFVMDAGAIVWIFHSLLRAFRYVKLPLNACNLAKKTNLRGTVCIIHKFYVFLQVN